MKNKITKAKLKELEEELSYRKNVLAPQITEEITRTLSPGDRFPNDSGIKKQNVNEDRIMILENFIKNSEIIEDEESGGDTVQIGSTVEISIDDKPTRTVKLISSEEAQVGLSSEFITEGSSIGKAITGKKVGSAVKAELINGKIVTIKILSIK